MNALEVVRSPLPSPIQLDPHLHAAVDLLRSPLVIHSKLKNVTVLEAERPTLDVRSAQPDVVEERPTRALRITNVELAAVIDPDLSVTTRDDLALERDSSRVRRRALVDVRGAAVSVCEATDADDRVAGHVAFDRVEVEGTGGFEVRDEAEFVSRSGVGACGFARAGTGGGGGAGGMSGRVGKGGGCGEAGETGDAGRGRRRSRRRRLVTARATDCCRSSRTPRRRKLAATARSSVQTNRRGRLRRTPPSSRL